LQPVHRFSVLLDNTFARRALIVVAWFVLGIGVIVYLNHRAGPATTTPAASGPAEVTTNPNTVGPRIAVPHAALQTARRFLQTGVLRQDLGASWDLASPQLRAGFSRARWMTGAIPVAQFPAHAFARAGFKVVSAHQRGVTLLVYIFPRKSSKVAGWDYFVQLVPHAGGWQVSYWQPRGHEAPVPLQAMG
jgi:hypothetical protein